MASKAQRAADKDSVKEVPLGSPDLCTNLQTKEGATWARILLLG